MTVAHLEDDMSAQELTEWGAYFEIEHEEFNARQHNRTPQRKRDHDVEQDGLD